MIRTTTQLGAHRTAIRRGARLLAVGGLALSLTGCGMLGAFTARPPETSATTDASASTGEESTSAESGSASGSAEDAGTALPEAVTANLMPATEADLEPAKQRFIDFYDTAGSGDYEGACAILLNRTTGAGAAGEDIPPCAASLAEGGDSFASSKGLIKPGTLNAVVQPDGTVLITMKATGRTAVMVKLQDGQLYLDAASM